MIKTTFMMVAFASFSFADPAALFSDAQKALAEAKVLEGRTFYLAASKLYGDAKGALENAQKEEEGYKTEEVARLLEESTAAMERTSNLGVNAAPPVTSVKTATEDHSVKPSPVKDLTNLEESIIRISAPPAHLRARGEAPPSVVARPVSGDASYGTAGTAVRTRFSTGGGQVAALPAMTAKPQVRQVVAQPSRQGRLQAAPQAVAAPMPTPAYAEPAPIARPQPQPQPAPMPVSGPTNGRSRFGH